MIRTLKLLLRRATPPAFDADDRDVAASGLFDVNLYLINQCDVHAAGVDPIRHFREHGWKEGRRPNVYFDPAWYREVYLAAEPETNPLLHYIRGGEQAGCRPIAYFDPGWYRATYAVDPTVSALAHFLAHRRSQRFAPNPLFDVTAYLERHRDEIGPNRDPFMHLLRYGALRDLDPGPAFDTAAYRRARMGEPEDAAADLAAYERRVPLVHHLDSLTRAAVRDRISSSSP